MASPTRDGKGHCQQPKAPGNPRVSPAALAGGQRIKDEAYRAATGHYRQRDHNANEEDKMENATEKLKRVEHPPEPQVEYAGDENDCPHHQSRMPGLWLVVLIVKDSEADYGVRNDCRTACAVDDPRTDGQPA